jgi:MFS family permease
MQTIAQGLLVLDLTGSGTQLGVVTALQTLPVLIFGAYGGVLADRFPKRSVLYVTQALAGMIALTMGILVASGQIQMWMVQALAVSLGFVNVVDNPTRQAFILELVGPDQIRNAVSLNSTEMNLARVVGPVMAGVLAGTVGLASCFIINGLSFFAVIAMMMRMDESRFLLPPRVAKTRGQLVAGLRYAWSNPPVRTTLLMMAIIGTFTYEFSVVLPLFSEFTFDGGPGAYAAMTAAMGAGAVVGGLYTAGRATTSAAALSISAALFGGSVLLTSLAPTLLIAVAALLIVGFYSISFTTLGNTTLQLATEPSMRGRVMALWTVAFLGTTPIGGPAMGAVGEHAGARWALVVGGVAALCSSTLGLVVLRRTQRALDSALSPDPVPQPTVEIEAGSTQRLTTR